MLHTFRCSLISMRLHRDMCVEMVESPIRFLAALPSAFVHALNFFITSPRAFMLLRAGYRNEGVNVLG